jgi:predicted nucleic acid-binding protein
MSGNNIKVYYWDTCVYLAWIMEEATHGPGFLEAMNQITHENFELKNVMFTSTLTFVEVTHTKLTPAQIEKFNSTFRPDSHIPYDLDRAIADKARVFRERFVGGGSKPLSTADAIHMATASLNNADEFHTFDDGQKDRKFIGLLELNGDVRVDRLVICKPFVSPPVLPAVQQNLTLPESVSNLPKPQTVSSPAFTVTTEGQTPPPPTIPLPSAV